jgi:hypothetical protein
MAHEVKLSKSYGIQTTSEYNHLKPWYNYSGNIYFFIYIIFNYILFYG